MGVSRLYDVPIFCRRCGGPCRSHESVVAHLCGTCARELRLERKKAPA